MASQYINVEEDGIFMICRDSSTEIVIEHIVSENKLGELANLGDSPKVQGDRLRFLNVSDNNKLEEAKEKIETKYREFEKKTVYSKDKKVRGRKNKKDKEEEERYK